MYSASTFETFKDFCQNRSFLKTRVALITLYNTTYPDWIEKILLLIEYLQLVSQALPLYRNVSGSSVPDEDPLVRWTIYFQRTINPASMLSFRQDNPITSIILIIILCSTVLKYLLFAYIIYTAYMNRTGRGVLIILWKWIFKIQARIVCFFITSFWIQTMRSIIFEDSISLDMNSSIPLVLSVIMIILEYLLSFLIEVQFCFKLPTNNFLSAKNCRIQFGTLLQKATMQIFQLRLHSESLSEAWIFSILNLILSLFKNYYFYSILPLYKAQALIYQGDLLNLVLSLNIASFFQTLLLIGSYDGANNYFIIIVWIILAILTIKASREFIKNKLCSLITNRSKGPAELLVHKISATKELRSHLTLPGEFTMKYNIKHLIVAIGNIKVRDIFRLPAEFYPDAKLDLDEKEDANLIFQHYLEYLTASIP